MPTTIADSSRRLLTADICLSSLSMDLFPQLVRTTMAAKTCRKPRCGTITTIHVGQVEMSPRECNAKAPMNLQGLIEVTRLVTVFDSRTRRGLHAGEFRWQGLNPAMAFVITGHLSGITNAGLFTKGRVTEPCGAPGILYGRLYGRVLEGPAALANCSLEASYRLVFGDSDLLAETSERASGSGTLEGVIIAPCPGK